MPPSAPAPRVGHCPAGPQGQEGDRDDRRRRVDRHRVPRRCLRRSQRAWISRAEVAEIGYTAFAGHKSQPVPGRLVVRRIPDLNPRVKHGQDALFDTWRFHAFFTTTAPSRSTPWPPMGPTAPTRSSSRSTPT